MQRRFKVERHPEYGELGLAPQWMQGEQDDPLGGMGVAHDILEHGSKDVCEWQGLGGAVYVRGEEYFNRRGRVGNSNAAENIGSDFHSLFHLWKGADIPDPGRTCRVSDEWAESLIQDAVREGCKVTRSEVKYSDKETACSAVHWTREEQRRRMVGWMRIGYRAAVRRWRGIERFHLTETFVAIETAVDALLKHGDVWEGAEVVITFSPRTETARAEVVYDDDY